MCVHTIWEASSIEHRETVRANLTRLVPPHRTPCVVRASCAVLARGIYARRSAAGSQTHLTQNLTHAFSCKFAFNAHKPHIAYLHRRGRPKRQEGLRERGCNRSIGYTPLVTFKSPSPFYLTPTRHPHISTHSTHADMRHQHAGCRHRRGVCERSSAPRPPATVQAACRPGPVAVAGAGGSGLLSAPARVPPQAAAVWRLSWACAALTWRIVSSRSWW